MSFYHQIRKLFSAGRPARLLLEVINRKADLPAKATLYLPHAILDIPYTDLKFQIDKCIISNWQDEWNNVGSNKLYSAKPVLGDWQSYYRTRLSSVVPVLVILS